MEETGLGPVRLPRRVGVPVEGPEASAPSQEDVTFATQGGRVDEGPVEGSGGRRKEDGPPRLQTSLPVEVSLVHPLSYLCLAP